jgi:hypothetical protein
MFQWESNLLEKLVSTTLSFLPKESSLEKTMVSVFVAYLILFLTDMQYSSRDS